jgi:(R,R)-butanediol dehydrogenase / meso-butanediol dehydrogenase / diacetyl reductase
MKAAVFHALHHPLRIDTIAEPKPSAGQVVVKVHRCGICSSDVHHTETPWMLPAPGTVLGHEFCGEIVELGAGVDHLRLGDVIACMPTVGCGVCATCLDGHPYYCASGQMLSGGYAEYAIAGAREAVRLPSMITPADGALVEPLAVAMHGIRRAHLQAGADTLVVGAGPIGLATVYWLRRLGARRIAVVARSKRHEALAMNMGADSFFTADTPDLPQQLAGASGGMPHTVFECVGHEDSLQSALQYTGPRGQVVVLGVCFGETRFTSLTALIREASVHFAMFYSRRDFELAVESFEAGHLEPRQMISTTIPLAQMPDVFEQLRGTTPYCKVHVDPTAV